MPLLKQFDELTSLDFEEHPVWIGVHPADYGEPWYEDTDEETFRPWDGDLPAHPSEGMLLVRSRATLANGVTADGFLTPSVDNHLGQTQPHVFAGDQLIGFWGGRVGVPDESRAAFREGLGVTDAEAFPIRFEVDPGIASGIGPVVVDGWY